MVYSTNFSKPPSRRRYLTHHNFYQNQLKHPNKNSELYRKGLEKIDSTNSNENNDFINQLNLTNIKNLKLYKELKGHNGCINCLEFSNLPNSGIAPGELLASGGDDRKINIYRNVMGDLSYDMFEDLSQEGSSSSNFLDDYTFFDRGETDAYFHHSGNLINKQLNDHYSQDPHLTIQTDHGGNILRVKFCDKNTKIHSVGRDGKIKLFDINSQKELWGTGIHPTETYKKIGYVKDMQVAVDNDNVVYLTTNCAGPGKNGHVYRSDIRMPLYSSSCILRVPSSQFLSYDGVLMGKTECCRQKINYPNELYVGSSAYVYAFDIRNQDTMERNVLNRYSARAAEATYFTGTTSNSASTPDLSCLMSLKQLGGPNGMSFESLSMSNAPIAFPTKVYGTGFVDRFCPTSIEFNEKDEMLVNFMNNFTYLYQTNCYEYSSEDRMRQDQTKTKKSHKSSKKSSSKNSWKNSNSAQNHCYNLKFLHNPASVRQQLHEVMQRFPAAKKARKQRKKQEKLLERAGSSASHSNEEIADDDAVHVQPVNSDPTRLEATINLPLIEKPRKKTTTDDPSSPGTLPPPIQQLKEAGNQFFVEDLFDRAIDKYSEALRKSVSDYNLKGHPILYSNRAQCYLKRGLKNDPYLALLDCLAALEIDPLNMKAHFRVLTAMNRLDYPAKLIKECINDFSKIHEKKKETREILDMKEKLSKKFQSLKNKDHLLKNKNFDGQLVFNGDYDLVDGFGMTAKSGKLIKCRRKKREEILIEKRRIRAEKLKKEREEREKLKKEEEQKPVETIPVPILETTVELDEVRPIGPENIGEEENNVSDTTEIYQSDHELRDPGDVIDEQDEAGRLSEEIDFNFMDFLQSDSTSLSNENRQPPSPPARDPRLQSQNTTEEETSLNPNSSRPTRPRIEYTITRRNVNNEIITETQGRLNSDDDGDDDDQTAEFLPMQMMRQIAARTRERINRRSGDGRNDEIDSESDSHDSDYEIPSDEEVLDERVRCSRSKYDYRNWEEDLENDNSSDSEPETEKPQIKTRSTPKPIEPPNFLSPRAFQKCYTGRSHTETSIKNATFIGNNIIATGSDTGHTFFWDKNTTEIVNIIKTDNHIANIVLAHPLFPTSCVAASGIDTTVKIYAPGVDVEGMNREDIYQVMESNTREDSVGQPMQMARLCAQQYLIEYTKMNIQSEHQIRNLLDKLKYHHVDQTLRQIMTAMSRHPGLHVEEDDFMDSSTQYNSTRLLKLTGTVKIVYKNATYHIPCDLYLPKVAPKWPIVGYVRPTYNMTFVQPHNNLGSDGKIYSPYISNWASTKGERGENLAACIDDISKIFSKKPPCSQKSTAQQGANPYNQSYQAYQQQQNPTQRSNNINNCPYPAMQTQNGGIPQPGGYQAYGSYGSTASVQGPPTYNYQGPTATSGPGYPTNNLPSYGQPAQPKRPPPPNPSDSYIKKQSLISNANDILKASAFQAKEMEQKEIKNMQEILKNLQNNKLAIEDKLSEVMTEQDKIKTMMEVMTPKYENQKNLLAEKEANQSNNQNDSIPVDELIKAKTPLERQIFDCHCQDLAIQDTIYELSKGLRNDIIDPTTFVKEVRKLGRKQFKLRAKVKKGREVMGFSS